MAMTADASSNASCYLMTLSHLTRREAHHDKEGRHCEPAIATDVDTKRADDRRALTTRREPQRQSKAKSSELMW
jgi:hypothetical protein